MAHSFTLLKAEVKALQQANALKKRRANKRRKRIQLGGSLTIEEGDELGQRRKENHDDVAHVIKLDIMLVRVKRH
ncbi:hypothetical protein GMDG_08888 [Pseudogymnoascus destructans 20631-21]|uniref:Uncharacterized protein n=1 Tax=Pseudogymnoascus destructans (strain ATCC MYA-4855 / 20631-21) TaxID=658429 RepID=L8FQI8_PSED2|nr:hypothetical protein GMDG_08888 [Pseudogymnoascus destructans 20631-21]